MQNQDPQRSGELTKLIDQFLDESISDQGMLELSDALQQSASLRRYFSQYSQLHLDLATEAEVARHSAASYNEFSKRCDRIAVLLRGQTEFPSQPEPASQPPLAIPTGPSLFQNNFSYTVALGVLFLLGVLSTVLTYELGGVVPSQSGRETASSHGGSADLGSESVPTVAHLTYINGCSWGGGVPMVRAIDSSVHVGEEVVLHEGIAEFRLSSGVSLSIEGPCSLVITSPSSIVLQHGRVTAYVPWSVADFQLVAASCRITASDAEFGSYVSGGQVELHAFSGHVVMEAVNSDGLETVGTDLATIEKEELLPPNSALARVVVNPDRALRVESDDDTATVSQWASADATQFATKLSMAGNLQISEEYVHSVLASKPVDYWRFEGAEDRMVRNEIADRPSLEIVGDLRFAGDSGNHVIELGRPGANGYLRCTEMLEIPAGDYSVEIWAKPSHVHVGGIVGMFTELPVGINEKLAFYLQVCGSQSVWGKQGQRKFRYLHRSPSGHLHEMGTSCYSTEHYKTRRWHHLAAVKQGPVMKLYVDGQLSSEERDATSLPPKLGLLVGQLTSPRHVGRFIGQLDEMAIYYRALTSEEVQNRMKSVDPKSILQHLSSRMSYSSLKEPRGGVVPGVDSLTP